MRPVRGGLTVWVLAMLVFAATGRLGVFSLGYQDLTDALRGDLPWQVAALLLGAKFAATVVSYGCGGCGGIFSPTLFLGGMTGLALAGAIDLVAPLTPDERSLLAVVGMSSCLGAVARAPVTGILIVFEMTHEFALVPPLMLASLISQAVSHRFCARNFYDSLLEQDGHRVEHLQPPRDLRTWQNRPVSDITGFSPAFLADLRPMTLRSALVRHPQVHFPVLQNGRLRGIVDRHAMEMALSAGTDPALLAAVTVSTDDSVRRVQQRLLESPHGVVVLIERGTQAFVGLLAAHDLLRAELAATERVEA